MDGSRVDDALAARRLRQGRRRGRETEARGGGFGRYGRLAYALRVYVEPVGRVAAARDVPGGHAQRRGGRDLPGRGRRSGRRVRVSPREVRRDPGGRAADVCRGTQPRQGGTGAGGGRAARVGAAKGGAVPNRERDGCERPADRAGDGPG